MNTKFKLFNELTSLLILILFTSLIFTSCGEDPIAPPPPGNVSDLTRTGKFIAFTSNRDNATRYDIFLAQVDVNGNLVTTGLVYPTNPYNLTASLTSREQNKQSNWSPDGRVMVFSSVQSNNEEIFAYFFNADGSIDSSFSPNPKKQFSSNGNWDNNPSFSPDGKYLIFDRRWNNNGGSLDSTDSRDLYIGDVTGSGNTFTVSNIREIMNTTGPDEFNPKWSPKISVRRVAYEYRGSTSSSDHDVYTIDPIAGGSGTVFYNPGKSGYPAWAPACDRIIFESDKGSGGFYQIVSLVYPPGSNNPIDIVTSSTQHLRYPTWLPNGGKLAYVVKNDPYFGSGIIYVTSVTGGTGTKLLPSTFDNANNLWPAW